MPLLPHFARLFSRSVRRSWGASAVAGPPSFSPFLLLLLVLSSVHGCLSSASASASLSRQPAPMQPSSAQGDDDALANGYISSNERAQQPRSLSPTPFPEAGAAATAPTTDSPQSRALSSLQTSLTDEDGVLRRSSKHETVAPGLRNIGKEVGSAAAVIREGNSKTADEEGSGTASCVSREEGVKCNFPMPSSSNRISSSPREYFGAGRRKGSPPDSSEGRDRKQLIAVPLNIVDNLAVLEIRVAGQGVNVALDSLQEGIRLYQRGSSACVQGKGLAESPSSDGAPEQGRAQHGSVDREPSAGLRELTGEDSAFRDGEAAGAEDISTSTMPVVEVDEAEHRCFDPQQSDQSIWCNNGPGEVCINIIGSTIGYHCKASHDFDSKAAASYSFGDLDGLPSGERRVQGFSELNVTLWSSDSRFIGYRGSGPVAVITQKELPRDWNASKFIDGFFGIAGPELCCRNESIWNSVLLSEGISLFGFDLNLSESISTSHREGHRRQVKGRHVDGTAEERVVDVVGKAAVGGKEEGRLDRKAAKHFSTVATTAHAAAKEADPTKSYLHLGTFPDFYGALLWSERKQTGGILDDAQLRFSAYNIQVCGARMLGRAIGNWEVVVDLSSQCLVVPYSMWTYIRAWLPVDKKHHLCSDRIPIVDDGAKTPPHPSTCPLLQPRDKRPPLPALSFELSQDGGPSQRVSLPLESLTYFDKSIGKDVLCVVPGGVYTGKTDRPPIRFGTRVLDALYIGVDNQSWRIGLAEKKKHASSNESCAAQVKCVGDQFYDAARNICIDPFCENRLYYHLNAETKTCELYSWLPYALAALLSFLVVLDLNSYHVYRRAVAAARARCLIN